MPLASFYNPCKHQITCSFLIYRLFADMSLSTVGYLRDLCLRLLVERRVRFTSENSCYKIFFFANECKYFYTLCKRRSERWHLHDWGCYLLFNLVYMFKKLIFANRKTFHNNHLSLERSVLIRVFFIKNTQRKINSGSPSSSTKMEKL